MFIFKGISSDDMDLVVKRLPPIEIPQKEIEEIEMDNKDGSYTIVKSYKTITKRVEVHYEGNNWDNLSYWLQGSGDLILGNLSDRYYKAYIKGSIPLEQIIKNKLSKFVISFVCQPFGYFLNNKRIVLNKTGNSELYNFGTVSCEPIFYIGGSGDITITIENENGTSNSYTLKNVNEYITLDGSNKICFKDGFNQSNKLVGKYPIIEPFSNKVSISGNVTKFEVLLNMRYLV